MLEKASVSMDLHACMIRASRQQISYHVVMSHAWSLYHRRSAFKMWIRSAFFVCALARRRS